MLTWQQAVDVMVRTKPLYSITERVIAAQMILLELGAFEEHDLMCFLQKRTWTGNETKEQIRGELWESRYG